MTTLELTLTILFSILGFALLTIILVVLIRTVRFKPIENEFKEDEKVEIDKEKAVTSLQTLVKCKTVSNVNRTLEDNNEFTKLIDSLKDLYPTVFENTTFTKLSDRALLFYLKGTIKEKHDPVVLMAHFDVVPANESNWEYPPFSGTRVDGKLIGRGTIDTKCTLNGVLRGAEELLLRGKRPNRDFYFAFAGDEETFGGSASLAVEFFKKNNITPYFVLDEGGAVINGVFPGVNKYSAMIGIAEKGQSIVEFHLKSGGGHASHPKPHTNVGMLAKLAVEIEKMHRKAVILTPIKEMFNCLGRHSTFVYRMIFANLWLFTPILKIITRKSGGQLNAIMRTTTALTQMQGSPANNVIPSEAMIGLNLRTLPTEKASDNIEELKKIAEKYGATLKLGASWDPSKVSKMDSDGYYILGNTIKNTWGKETIISPYVMTACADAHLYDELSDKVYRFSPMKICSEQMNMIHGDNEYLTDNQIAEVVEFYYRLMKNL